MEKNSAYTIDIKTLAAGQKEFMFNLGPAFFGYFENREILNAACAVEIIAEKWQRGAKLDVAIRGSVTVACDRCADEVEIPVNYHAALYVKHSESIEKSYFDDNGEEETLWVTDTEADLRQYLYDSIMLSLPMQRFHADGKCNNEIIRNYLK